MDKVLEIMIAFKKVLKRKADKRIVSVKLDVMLTLILNNLLLHNALLEMSKSISKFSIS